VEPTYKPFVHQPYHPWVNPFTRNEDESVSRVLCVRVLAPTEGLGGAALVGRVLQSLNYCRPLALRRPVPPPLPSSLRVVVSRQRQC
jgi:hypothetical protein